MVTTFLGELYTSFAWIPTAVLGAALALKLPAIIRLWREPLLRAVGGLLLLACAVFVFVMPPVITWTNRVTGVPNFSAPWVYSLLTAFSGAGLLLIVTWRNGLSDRSDATRRARRWVISVYAGVIVALWVLFALADAPVERVRDLDTYYADTPFMREMIVLYLLGHTVAVLITGRLIWNWVRADGLHGWLRWGLTFLGAGYALNLGFDLAKLTAVAARWTGHDLDTLSTDIAPCAACLGAILIAVGFILPHTGQYLHGRLRVRLAHHQLRPLYVLMRSVRRRRRRPLRALRGARTPADPAGDVHPRRPPAARPPPRRRPPHPGPPGRPQPRLHPAPREGTGRGGGDPRRHRLRPRAPHRPPRHRRPPPGTRPRLPRPAPPRRDRRGARGRTECGAGGRRHGADRSRTGTGAPHRPRGSLPLPASAATVRWLSRRMSWHIAAVRTKKEMRRFAAALIDPMRVPVPAEPEALFDALVDSVTRWRGREVVVRREVFPPHTASGLWLEGDTYDVIVIDKRAAAWHQIVIFCHEVWHMHQRTAQPTPSADGSPNPSPPAPTSASPTSKRPTASAC